MLSEGLLGTMLRAQSDGLVVSGVLQVINYDELPPLGDTQRVRAAVHDGNMFFSNVLMYGKKGENFVASGLGKNAVVFSSAIERTRGIYGHYYLNMWDLEVLVPANVALLTIGTPVVPATPNDDGKHVALVNPFARVQVSRSVDQQQQSSIVEFSAGGYSYAPFPLRFSQLAIGMPRRATFARVTVIARGFKTECLLGKDGSCFSVLELSDGHERAACILYDEAHYHFHPLAIVGHCYEIKCFDVRPIEMRFALGNRRWQLEFNPYTEFTNIDHHVDGTARPSATYNIVTIDSLEGVPAGSFVDVLAVVKRSERTRTVYRIGGHVIRRRLVTLTDDRLRDINLILWNSQTEPDIYNEGDVLLLTNAKRVDFDGISLFVPLAGAINSFPTVQKLRRLVGWFKASKPTLPGILETENDIHFGRLSQVCMARGVLLSMSLIALVRKATLIGYTVPTGNVSLELPQRGDPASAVELTFGEGPFKISAQFHKGTSAGFFSGMGDWSPSAIISWLEKHCGVRFDIFINFKRETAATRYRAVIHHIKRSKHVRPLRRQSLPPPPPPPQQARGPPQPIPSTSYHALLGL